MVGFIQYKIFPCESILIQLSIPNKEQNQSNLEINHSPIQLQFNLCVHQARDKLVDFDSRQFGI